MRMTWKSVCDIIKWLVPPFMMLVGPIAVAEKVGGAELFLILFAVQEQPWQLLNGWASNMLG